MKGETMPQDKNKSAMDEFLADIPVADQSRQDDSMFGQSLDEGAPVTPEKEEKEEPRKNRHHRRLEAKYQSEREANIALAARVEALTEVQKFARETNTGNVDEKLIQLYGNDEKGLLAAKITQDLLNQTKDVAKREALEEFQRQQEVEQQEVASSQGELDEMLEEVEDEYNVDLTSDTPTALRARQGFFKALEEISPKNKEGHVTDYADPLATWKYFQTQQKPADTRAKDLSARGMVRSGSSGDSKLEVTAQERFLRDAGII